MDDAAWDGIPDSELPNLVTLATNMHFNNTSLTELVAASLQRLQAQQQTVSMFSERQMAHLLETAVMRSHGVLIIVLSKFTPARELERASAAEATTGTDSAATATAGQLQDAQGPEGSGTDRHLVTQALLLRLLRMALLLEQQEAAIVLDRHGGPHWSTEHNSYDLSDLKLKEPDVVRKLCRQRLVQTLVTDVRAIASLLQLAVQLGNKHGAVCALCKLPAAQQISASQLAELLLTRMQLGASSLEQLAQGQLAAAVQRMPEDTLCSVLQAAAAHQCLGAAQAVSGCPGARTASSTAAAAVTKAVLKAAQRSGNRKLTKSLLDLDAVLLLSQRLNAADGSLADCLRAAISYQSVTGLTALLDLEAAGAIGVQEAASLLQLAISRLGDRVYREVPDCFDAQEPMML